MREISEIDRRLAGLIQFGSIEQVDVDEAVVRVSVAEVLTDWMPWMSLTGRVKSWLPPKIGEKVIVLAPSGLTENGVVVRGIFTDDNPSPSTDLNQVVIQFENGDEIIYNLDSGSAHVKLGGSAVVESGGNLTLKSSKVIIDGDLQVVGDAVFDATVKNAGKSIDSTHKHTSNTPGQPSSPPI